MLSGRKGGRSNLQISIYATVYASHGKSKSSPSKKISSFFSLQRSADFHFHDREKYYVLPPPMGNRNTLYERKSVHFFLFRNENASHQTIRKEAAWKNQKCFSLPQIPLIAVLHKRARCDYEPFVLLNIQIIEHQEGYVIWKIRTISSIEDSACYTNAPVVTTNHSYC